MPEPPAVSSQQQVDEAHTAAGRRKSVEIKISKKSPPSFSFFFSFLLSLNDNDHRAFDGVYREGKTLTSLNEKTARAVGTHTRSHAHALDSARRGITLGLSCSRCQDITAFCSRHQANISPQSLRTPPRFLRRPRGSPAARRSRARCPLRRRGEGIRRRTCQIFPPRKGRREPLICARIHQTW